MYEEDGFHLERLEDWVDNKCTGWRDNFEANYSQKFDEYYRLWRGQWSAEDMTRTIRAFQDYFPCTTAGC